MRNDDDVIDIELVQGADFGVQIYWTSPDQVPFTVLSPMRMEIKDAVGNVVHTLSTDGTDGEPSILYNSESGLIQLRIPGSATGAMPVGRFDADLFVTYQDNAVTNATRVHRLFRANVYVEKRITTSV